MPSLRSSRASPRPEPERTDSGFASLSMTPRKTTAQVRSSPRKGVTRSVAHSPSLSSGMDSSPASTEAHRRRQEEFGQQVPRRPFVQGFSDGDNIFGIRVPSRTRVTPQAENQAFREAHPPAADGTPQIDSSEIMPDDQENGSDLNIAVPEPTKTPLWVRAGPVRPLGEMKIDPRAGLGLDTTLDLDSSSINLPVPKGPHTNGQAGRSISTTSSSSDSSAGRKRKWSAEYPPSPKKSPIKRLLFKTLDPPPRNHGLDLDSTYGSQQASQSDDDKEEDDDGGGDDSLFGIKANSTAAGQARGKSRVQQQQPPPPPPTRDIVPPIPSFPPQERPPRPRRSLMRRRRTTRVHEDPITSPNPGADTLKASDDNDDDPGPGPGPATIVGPSSTESTRASVIEDSTTVTKRPTTSYTLGRRREGLRELTDEKTTTTTPRRAERKRIEALEERMWEACGRDVARWNRGDFGGGGGGGVAALGRGMEGLLRW